MPYTDSVVSSSSGCIAGQNATFGLSSVEDYDLWKAAFDDLRSVLQTAGCKGEFVFRNADDPNQITVMSEIDSLEKARAFVAAHALHTAM